MQHVGRSSCCALQRSAVCSVRHARKHVLELLAVTISWSSPVKKTMDTASPKRYSCSPHAPTAFMMEALWITLTGMPLCRARSSKSVCVVALVKQHT